MAQEGLFCWQRFTKMAPMPVDLGPQVVEV